MCPQELMASAAYAQGSHRDRITRALARRFRAACFEITGPISVRDNSQVFRAYVATDPPRDLAVKSCLLPHSATPDRRSTAEQYAALTRLHGTFTQGRQGHVPEPVFVDEEGGIFGMSWIEGISLTSLMRQAVVLTRGAQAFEAVGAWLGTFHSLGPLREEVYGFGERLAALDEFARSVPPQAHIATAARFLIRTAPGLAEHRMSTSWLHGDCKTDNFLLQGSEVFGIDISLRHENAIEHDLAQFLNNVELAFLDPRCVHLVAARSTLKSAFWRGYSRTGPGVCETFLYWMRLYTALSLWHSTLGLRKRGRVRSWYLNRGFARLARRLERWLAHRVSGLDG